MGQQNFNDGEKTDKLPDKNELIEGIHFYYEKEYMVFTEAYHIKRGYCCGNGCRHCPYKK